MLAVSLDRNSHDPRRYRDRATGLVYRVLNDRGPHGGPDLAPILGGAAREVALDALDRDYVRCDVIERGSPVCATCGGEKFTVPGQRANLGWLCFHCHPRERAAAEAPYPEVPAVAVTIAPDGAVAETSAAPTATTTTLPAAPTTSAPSRVGRVATIPDGLPRSSYVLRAWAQASGLSARYFGCPVYLVGGALTDDDPRDLDLVVAMPDELFVCSYGDHPWQEGALRREIDAWETSKNDANPAPVWRRWARDCAKQSALLTLAVGRAVDFKVQPQRSFAAYDFKPRVRLDCAFMPEEKPL